MKKILHIIPAIIIVVTMFCRTGTAEPDGLAISAKAGTLGLGGELIANIAPSLNARVGGNILSFGIDAKASDIDYKFGIDMRSFTALLDWHLFNNSFRISGGILVNQNEASMTATPSNSVMIGGNPYTPAEIGTLSGELTYDKEIAPYIGIGWGNPFDSKGKFGFMLDLGVAFTGSPGISLSASNPAVSPADLEAERADIENELHKYNFYPVLSLCLYYRF